MHCPIMHVHATFLHSTIAQDDKNIFLFYVQTIQYLTGATEFKLALLCTSIRSYYGTTLFICSTSLVPRYIVQCSYCNRPFNT